MLSQDLPDTLFLFTELCSVRYDQLFNDSSTAGPPPQVQHTGTVMTSINDAVTFTCPNGYNVHNLAAFHSLTLTCGGFKEGWRYPAELDKELHGVPVECVFGEYCSVPSARSRGAVL